MICEEFFEKTEFVTNPGNRYRDVLTPDIDKDGNITLVLTGKEDLWDTYNSYRDSCDTTILVERFLSGDESALQRGTPVFMDLLGAPKSLAEAYALNFRAEKAFESLDSSIKEKFGNSYMRFVSEAGSPEWFSALKVNQDIDVKEESTLDS